MASLELHLDPLGGIAGDMFAAALLDAFPEHEAAVRDAIGRACPDGIALCRLERHRDRALAGARFVIEPAERQGHGHAAWAGIKAGLERAALAPAVAGHALGIFALLAEAEARVHGIDPREVTFHELGGVDSIADIVAAAQLIVLVDAARWTIGPLPLGSGTVETAHGLLPVPAPATALLIEGFLTRRDEIPGERVTPTGAAIVRHLGAAAASGEGPLRLLRSGIGLGSRSLPGIANALRVLAFEPAEAAAGSGHRELAVVEFEVDDQSAEDLAIGLERLRALDGVHDVVQTPVFGKKGRIMSHVRLLARPEALEDAIEACFLETTTIGLRWHRVAGRALARQSGEAEVGGRRIRVKTVERPGGARTAKAEADDAALETRGHAARLRLRQAAERQALEEPPAC